MNCKVCFLPYDSTSRKPMILPCGHTFCVECLEKSANITTSEVTCPKDSKRLSQPNGRVDEFVVNFDITGTLTSRKPMILPYGHTFCVECLDKSVNIATSEITCPTDRKRFSQPNGRVDEFVVNFDMMEIDDCCDCKKKPQEHPCLPEHCSIRLCSDFKRKHLRMFHADLLSEINIMKQDITQKQVICDDNSKLTEMVHQSSALIAEVNKVFDSEKNKLLQTIKSKQMTDSKEYLEWKKLFNLRLQHGQNALDNITSYIQCACGEPTDQDLMDLSKQISLEKEDIATIEKSGKQPTQFKPSLIQPEFDKMMPVLYQKVMESVQPEACVPGTTPFNVMRGMSLQTLIPDYKAAKFSGSYGKFGSGAGEFNQPWGICTSPVTGNLAVSEFNSHRIQILSPELQPIAVFGEKGSGDNEYQHPTGVTFSTDGSIFICDCNNHRIQHVREDGTFINKFGSYGTGDGQFHLPNGICWDRGLLYICDRWNRRVQVMEESGVHMRNIGSIGSAPGQFPEQTFHVAVSTQHDKLVVSDVSGNLYFFAIDGQHKKTITTRQQPYKMKAGGIAIDKQGHIILHDRVERNLVILGQNEEVIKTIGLPFRISKAVTITNKLGIVVCDWNNHRLVQFTVPQIKSN